MDNASKALIIAGAVLIAVMLVSVGVMIYNQAAGVITQGQSNMDALEITMANQTYTQYEGANKNRNAVGQLLDTIAQAYDAASEHTVAVEIKGGETNDNINVAAGTITPSTIRTAATNIRKASNYKYTVVFGKDQNGYIDSVTITASKGTKTQTP